MSDTTAPEVRTRLDAVHGCRAEDVRGSLWYNHEEGCTESGDPYTLDLVHACAVYSRAIRMDLANFCHLNVSCLPSVRRSRTRRIQRTPCLHGGRPTSR